MSLVDDITQIEYNAAGAGLIRSSTALRQQRTDTVTEISTLRPAIKADVANDIWSRADITRLIQLLDLRDSIDAQLASVKSEIQALRAVIANAAYETELLAEELLIP